MSLPVLGCAIGAAIKDPPVLRGSVQVSSQASGTSFNPTLPAHQSGDIIAVVVSYNGNGAVNVTPSGGWTQETQRRSTNDKSCLAVFSRTATGSAHTITITNNNNLQISAHVYVLRQAGDIDAASATDRDPPSLAPSWGVDNHYWIAVAATAGGSSLPASGPTGFGNSVQTDNNFSSLSTLDRVQYVSPQNPDTFSGGGGASATNDVSATIGIRPL